IAALEQRRRRPDTRAGLRVDLAAERFDRPAQIGLQPRHRVPTGPLWRDDEGEIIKLALGDEQQRLAGTQAAAHLVLAQRLRDRESRIVGMGAAEPRL